MRLFGDDFAKRWRSRSNTRALEDALLEMSEEISGIKASIAKLNAKNAVEVRKTRVSGLDRELRQLELEYGGKVVDVQDPAEVK
jgi:hypothetical protein